MPRVLILCEYPTLLGGERSMLAMIPGIRAAGFDAHLAGPADSPLFEAAAQYAVETIAWQTHDATGQRLSLEQLRASAGELIDRVAPDLAHANSLSTSRISGPVVADRQVRSLGHLRDIVKLAPQAIADLNCHRRLLAVSNATRNFHVAQGIDAVKCHVLYNGVDLGEFAPRAPSGYLHRMLNVPPTARFVAVIGQLGLRKATDVALAAAAKVAIQLPQVYWLVVGDRTSNKQESREFEARLRQLATTPTLAGRVHFLGSRGDVPQLLNESVLLVHAARQEPLGRVLLEAAASGLPVVATDVGGTREIFPAEQHDGALLVPVDDAKSLADAQLKLLVDEPCRQKIARAARRRAAATFDIYAASGRLVDEYRQVLDA